MLGVADYEPVWLDSSEALLASHGDRLSSLMGATLEGHWVVADRTEDDWFNDMPIVLIVGGVPLEVACWKFDEMAISWGEIDLSRPIDWHGTGLDLEWRADWLPVLNDALGLTVTDVWITEQLNKTRLMDGEGAPESQVWLLSGLELGFGSSRLEVFNGLDEIRVEYGKPAQEDWLRRIAVTTSAHGSCAD